MNDNTGSPDSDHDNSRLHAEAVKHQTEFDQLAVIHEQGITDQIERRRRMREALVAHENGMLRMIGAADASTPRDEISHEEMVELIERFDADAIAYVRQCHESRERFARLRDLLAAFIKTRAQLRKLGCAAPELIQHEAFVASLQSLAFGDSPADPPPH
ncbi:MAG TPA: hypothetical protein VL069_15955 [Opitutus sp.]|nr:hypothetical protein [Opitutus sp.]